MPVCIFLAVALLAMSALVVSTSEEPRGAADSAAVDSTWRTVGEIDTPSLDVKDGEEDDGGGMARGTSQGSLPAPQSPAGLSRKSSADISAMYDGYNIPPHYDYTRSTEDNYSMGGGTFLEPQHFVGKYKEQRARLDYSFHKPYRAERQLFHDCLMDLFHHTRVFDDAKNLYCDRPLENWIVFTAGPMGAGKGHTMQWLQRETHHGMPLFPLAAFVKVDPDSLRELLPETPEYIRRNPLTAGALTQKEVGYIAEVLTMDALQQGKNVLVDGSLKDAEWYLHYIASLRRDFPRLKIAIIHVKASEASILARCRRRAEDTGRMVPEEVIQSAIRQIPNTLRLLAPRVDYLATFENEDGGERSEPSRSEPHLLQATKSVSINNLAALLDAAGLDERRPEYMYDAGAGAGDGRDSDAWRAPFQAVWKMECAVPARRASKSEL